MTSNDNHNIATGRGSKFLKDIGVYAIGNIGSKIITFLMVPLYTYFVHDKSDFGYYDVCLQVCLLLIPFVTLQLRDGAFRFLLDCDDTTQRKRIVTFVSRTLATTLTLSALVTILMALFTDIQYLGYVLGLLVAMSLQEVIPRFSVVWAITGLLSLSAFFRHWALVCSVSSLLPDWGGVSRAFSLPTS